MFCMEKPAYHMFKMMWIGLLPFTLVMINWVLEERDRRVEDRKRKREEMEQEREDALFADEMDIQNVQELYG